MHPFTDSIDIQKRGAQRRRNSRQGASTQRHQRRSAAAGKFCEDEESKDYYNGRNSEDNILNLEESREMDPILEEEDDEFEMDGTADFVKMRD